MLLELCKPPTAFDRIRVFVINVTFDRIRVFVINVRRYDK
jgi:hypothetical protein